MDLGDQRSEIRGQAGGFGEELRTATMPARTPSGIARQVITTMGFFQIDFIFTFGHDRAARRQN